MLNTKPISGIFTVNDFGKKVQFASGNLFWDGTHFKCEKHQYNYSKEWNPKHINLFYWCNDSEKARSENYNVPYESFEDVLFAANGNLIEGWTVLTREEWDYLSKRSIAKHLARIADVNCTILIPDGINNSVVASTYTASEWADAEKEYGLVALPLSGYREGAKLCHSGYFVGLCFMTEEFVCGEYWSKTHGLNPKEPNSITLSPNEAFTHIWNRRWACSIRLVSEIIPQK